MNNALNNGGHGAHSSQESVPSDGISVKLREFYRQLEQEDIPNNLLMLLEKLDKAEKASAAATENKADD
ncbi:NepR family anti-sigma factor [Rhizobium sp.]|uniref:NepR family anti-sigma factor n=1 Tax=Rhizobium sp. TaxID=391 RepID=UPI000E7D4E9B|nr:hypothetical protein [Rhizobium sp.]